MIDARDRTKRTIACAVCAKPIPMIGGSLCDGCARALLAGAASHRNGSLGRSATADDDDVGTGAAKANEFPRPFGKYALEGELGRGGMGVVYRAYDRDADRRVAIKVLTAVAFASDDDVRRFQDEARKIARLDHPGIVRVYDVGVVDDVPYFAMELVDGASLESRIDGYTADARKAARLVADTAAIVHHAHQRFVLHCDIKPANILLDREGKPHVVDFGVARRLEPDATKSASIAGTASYMAPEQIEKPADVNVAADVYALGAVLYELLCGRPPIEGESVAQILKNVVAVEPTAPRDVRPEARIPRDLETICLKCLRKQPSDRYASAAGVAHDLERFLHDEPIAARRASTTERVVRAIRRHRIASIGAAAAALIVVATMIVAVSVAREQEAELRRDALTTNAYAARALSGAVLFELRALGDDAARIAADPWTARVLADVRAGRAGDDTIARDVAAWRTNVAHAPCASALLLDDHGSWIARSPEAAHDQDDFSWRDYWRGADELGRSKRRGVYVSRGYVSTAAHNVRITISAPVFGDDGAYLGVVDCGIETGDALGALKLGGVEGGRTAVLLARADRDSKREATLPSDWHIVVHDGVGAGSEHRVANVGPLASIDVGDRDRVEQLALAGTPAAVDDDWRDPVAHYDGRWLAGIAPVGDTHLAVVVETREDAAVAPNARLASRLLTSIAVVLLCAAAAFALVALVWRRRA